MEEITLGKRDGCTVAAGSDHAILEFLVLCNWPDCCQEDKDGERELLLAS